VFVGGPIKHAFKQGAFDTDLRTLIDAVVDGLVELDCTVACAHRYESFAPLPEDRKSGLVARDFAWMRWCDLYLALVPLQESGVLVPSLGTGVEIGWAMRLAKPIVAAIDVSRSSHYSPFLLDLAADDDVQLVDIATVATPDSLARIVGGVSEPDRHGGAA
jgi:nucleoside 2-deoxyribosyltransferase